MIAFDTSVFARWIMREDADQAAQADVALSSPFFLGTTVLVELGWILRSVGGMDRQEMARALNALVALPTAWVEHAEHVRWAIERYATQGDFADLIHLANSTEATTFATFDRRLIRQAGANPPVPVVVLNA